MSCVLASCVASIDDDLSSLFLPPWCERLPYAMAAHGRMRPIRLRGSLAWVLVEVATAGFNKIFSLTYFIMRIYSPYQFLMTAN